MQESGYVDRPDYRVDLLRRRNKVTASKDGVILAQTERPLLVDEQDHGIVFYFPEGDVRLDKLSEIEHSTRCPYKGSASHWSIIGTDEPIAWTYREPYPQVTQILGHIAFYQDRVDVQVGVANPAVVGYKR
jgi:uncharacterized protein (DUF427 family)